MTLTLGFPQTYVRFHVVLKKSLDLACPPLVFLFCSISLMILRNVRSSGNGLDLR